MPHLAGNASAGTCKRKSLRDNSHFHPITYSFHHIKSLKGSPSALTGDAGGMEEHSYSNPLGRSLCLQAELAPGAPPPHLLGGGHPLPCALPASPVLSYRREQPGKTLSPPPILAQQ